MKKIIVTLIVLLSLFGCTTKNNNGEDDHNDDQSDWHVVAYDEDTRIWIVNDYSAISMDDYYKQEKTYSDDQDLVRIVAKDSDLTATYDADVTKGLYVQTSKVISSSYDEETGKYTPGSKEERDKQYFVESSDASDYKSIGISDGHWFYYQKRVYGGDSLVRVSYMGEEQTVLEDFDLNDCYSFAYPDQDVLYILKYNSFKKDYTVKLYWIYMNGMVVEEIDSGILATDIILPEFIKQESSYHILYTGENPLFTEKLNELKNDETLLNDLLKKYSVTLKEDDQAYLQYNSYVYNYILHNEYGLDRKATFDYDVVNKSVSYSPIESDPAKPSEETPYWK